MTLINWFDIVITVDEVLEAFTEAAVVHVYTPDQKKYGITTLIGCIFISWIFIHEVWYP